MNWLASKLWIGERDPDRRLTELQRMNVESALARDDIKTAKKYIDDYLRTRR